MKDDKKTTLAQILDLLTDAESGALALAFAVITAALKPQETAKKCK